MILQDKEVTNPDDEEEIFKRGFNKRKKNKAILIIINLNY
jgi:hypothetical protein